jgi:hypothetical protein
MQLSLISIVTGKVLNKKAQGQSHFKRTTNWKATWVKGIKRIEDAYKKSQGFYDALALIEDRDQYKAEIIREIEAIDGWEQNSMLSDFHGNVSRGGILTTKQRAALLRAAEKSAQRGPPIEEREEEERPPPPKPEVDDKLIQQVRDLYKAAHRSRDQWLLKFTESIGKRLKAGQPLSPKQQETLDKNLKRYRLASRQDPVAARVARRFLSGVV